MKNIKTRPAKIQKKKNDQGLSSIGVVKKIKAPIEMIRIPIIHGTTQFKKAFIKPKCDVFTEIVCISPSLEIRKWFIDPIFLSTFVMFRR